MRHLQLLDNLPVCRDFKQGHCDRAACRYVHLMEGESNTRVVQPHALQTMWKLSTARWWCVGMRPSRSARVTSANTTTSRQWATARWPASIRCCNRPRCDHRSRPPSSHTSRPLETHTTRVYYNHICQLPFTRHTLVVHQFVLQLLSLLFVHINLVPTSHTLYFEHIVARVCAFLPDYSVFASVDPVSPQF